MLKYKKEILVIILLTLLFGLYKIVNVSFGYDTDLLILKPHNIMDSWLSLSRYGLVFLKYIFHLHSNVNLRLFNIITYLNVSIYSILFLYFLGVDRESKFFKNILSVLVVITSPILLEQYNFTLQSPEVSFGMILMMISFITTYKFLKEKKFLYSFITVLLLTLCFGIYQAFVNLYVLGALICVYKLSDYKQNILKTFIIFIVSFIFYFIISNIVISVFDIEKSTYLSSQIGWFSGFNVIFEIFKDFIKVIIGKGNILNFGYLICFFILFLYAKQSKKLSLSVLVLLIILSPLLLNFVTCSKTTHRSLFAIPFMMSFVFYEFYDLKRYIKFLLFILIIYQIATCYLLMIGDYKRYINDIEISRKIYSDCSANENTIIYLYGIERTDENIKVYKGEEMGYSFYEWSVDGINVSDYRVENFMNIHGINFIRGNISDKSVSFGAEYPNDGYVVKRKNKCYVNLGI